MTLFQKEKDRWLELDPALAPNLSDARLQLHHAAQFVACMGISYLPKADDDSHTNMQWMGGTLAGQLVGPRPFRLAVRPHPLALVVIVGNVELSSLPLRGRTIADGADWIRAQARALGLDPARYSLAKHYSIPTHPVDRGVPFDTADAAAFEQLGLWYNNANLALARMEGGASSVRCWPHHFDIATLLSPFGGRTVGIGMEPGDAYYGEPYWYLNVSPAPIVAPTGALTAGGSWHTHEWIGAVLPGSRLERGQRQAFQVAEFIASAQFALLS